MTKCITSNRALASMVSEIERYPEAETGGVLLGAEDEEKYWIVEAVDAGQNAVHGVGTLTCDMESVNHMIKGIAGLYESNLEVIGIWHKHNHCCNPPFSEEDMELHESMARQHGKDIVSILFQKMDNGGYRMRVFRCSADRNITEEEFDIRDVSEKFPYRTF